MSKRWLAGVVLLFAWLSIPDTQAQIVSTHAAVTGVNVTQVLAKQRVRVDWQPVSTANKYRIKITLNGARVAKQTVTASHAKFKERKFRDNQTYVIWVRAKARAGYAVNNWTTYNYTFNDIDHDNDLILDTSDYDDDNDGIPDTLDSNPTGLSGTVSTVVIRSNTLEKGTITIQRGDSVTWVNQDGDQDHTIVGGGGISSPPLQYNESYTFTFNTAGVYNYYDPTVFASTMSGTISVLNP